MSAQRDQGHKADAGKLRYDLIPVRGEELLARVLTHGAEKYGAHSWRLVPEARERYTAALMRHLAQWRSGQTTDPDSGLPHIAHLLCNAMFLADMEHDLCNSTNTTHTDDELDMLTPDPESDCCCRDCRRGVEAKRTATGCSDEDCDEPSRGDEPVV